jgi:hypothetical protein
MSLRHPGDVPEEVVEYVAAQLDVAAASMATCTEREKTRLEHQWEIAREVDYRDFADVEAELAVWVDDRTWTTGERPGGGLQRCGWLAWQLMVAGPDRVPRPLGVPSAGIDGFAVDGSGRSGAHTAACW